MDPEEFEPYKKIKDAAETLRDLPAKFSGKEVDKKRAKSGRPQPSSPAPDINLSDVAKTVVGKDEAVRSRAAAAQSASDEAFRKSTMAKRIVPSRSTQRGGSR
jgi:hypothetical protein